ncbi:MAG TPA: RNA methyltransferase [Planctomycetaceae bacterium]|nr:RNA methyltransferase [Planctomycetaceae bacterium]
MRVSSPTMKPEKPVPTILSPQNPRVKAAVRLRDARHRQKQGRFLIDGLREIERACAAGIELVEMFHCPARYPAGRIEAVERLLSALDAERFEVAPAVFDKLAFGDRAEGMVAVAATPSWRLDDFELTPGAVVAVIEAIEKPGNVGAVLRSADAAGVDLVIVADGRTDLFNPNTIRASLGTIFTVPVREATASESLQWLRSRRLPIFAARVDGSVGYTEVDYRDGAAIVLGSEAEGLSPVWRADDIRAVRLPMHGAADSLNISATAAVLFYEALRQRG